MDIKEQKAIRSVLRGFSFKEVQLGRDVWQTAKEVGVSLKTLRSFISLTIQQGIVDREQMLKNAKDTKARMEELLPKCPECGFMFFPRPIKIEKGPGNLYGRKTHWLCGSCFYEEYSDEDCQELYDKVVGRR